MILIVVAVHAVAADRKHILELVEVGAHDADAAIGAEICRIGLGYPHNGAIENIGQPYQSNFCKLTTGEVQKVSIAHTPKAVALAAEVFESQPDGAGIGDQRRAPVVENLQASELH